MADDKAHYPPPLLAWAIIAAFFLAYIFSFVDRMIIGLLVEPIKADLGVTDTQISLLQGLAFALFYTIAGIPIGRMVDRVHRFKLVAGGIALWSVMTALCGWAGTFWHLFAARMGVGVGEAVLSPAAYSVIADSFPRRRLGLAMGVYSLGAAVGAGLAFMIGAMVIGFVAHADSIVLPFLGTLRVWQIAFLVVGLPGLVLAVIFWLLPEPRRIEAEAAAIAHDISWRSVWRFMRSQAGLLVGVIGSASLVNLGAQAAISWFPVMLIRAHGLTVVGAGYLAGSALIVGGVIGMIGGGWLADRMAGGTPLGRLTLCAIATSAGVLGAAVFPLVDNLFIVWPSFVLFFAAVSVTIGAAPAILQQVVPNRMRGTLSAVYLLSISVIGIGLGPTTTAILADSVFPFQSGIRYAIALAATLSYALAALLFLWTVHRLRRRDVADRNCGPP